MSLKARSSHKRFRGNKETKKVQKTLLKQQYENFSGTTSESLDQIHDTLQKLISQLEILGEIISQEDINLKFLRILPSEWKTHTLIWRNKDDLEEQNLDDLFNNLKIYEAEVKGSSTSSQNIQNIAFVSLNNTDSTNESVNVVLSVSAASSKATVSTLLNVDSLSDDVIYSFFASQSNSPQLENKDLKQIDADYLEEIDLKWQMAMLTMRARRFLQKTRRSLGANGIAAIGFDMSKVECYNCHKRGLFAGECRSPRDNRNKEASRRTVLVEVSTSNALVSQCDAVGSYDWGLESVEARLVRYQQNETVFEDNIKLLKLDVMLRDNALVELRKKLEKAEKERDDLKLTLEKFQNSFKNLSKLLESQISDKTRLGYDSQVFDGQVFNYEELPSFESDDSVPKSPKTDRYKSGEGYHVVPPPYTRTFMTHKPDLIFNDVPYASESVTTVLNVESSTNQPSKDMSKTLRPDALIIEDWTPNSEVENVIESVPKQKEPSFVQTSEHVKTLRVSVKIVEHPKQAENLKTDTQKSRGHKDSWNRKVCLVCKSLSHLIKDYDYYEKQMVQIHVWNNAMRMNHQNSARMTHPHSNRNVVSTTVLTRSRLVPLNTAKPISTVVPQSTVKSLRPVKHVVNKAHSHIRRPINHKLATKNSNFNHKVTTVKVNKGIPQQALKDKGVIDSGCSRHMTQNISFLLDFEAFNGGYVAFGGNPKGGKILGKGSGPKWLFDIDTLTQSMNYQPVVVGNQPNYNLGIKENLDADPHNTYVAAVNAAFDVQENENDLRAESEEFSSNSTNRVNAASAPVNAVGPNPTNSTNGFNTASPFDTAVSSNFRIASKSSFVDPFNYPDDPDMPALEDIVYSDYEEDVGAEADLSNLETNITVSRTQESTPSTQDLSWIESMQEELLQLKMQKVWVLVYLPKGKRAIGSKWVFRNKKDERGIVIKNKARLVAQGHTQEEGINYDEVFALVARIEAIQLFLAYASFIGFMVYQMDVKSNFLYETIKEEVYVCKPLGFEDPDYPDKVYKMVKALYGLHQAPKAWYETLANYPLENGFQRGKIDQTLFIKKQKGVILLVQVYVDDIIYGSTNKELCKAFEKLMKDKFHMSSIGELTFFLGLQVKQKDNGIFISQDKYIAEILRMFGFTDVKSASTPIETEKPLL
uniref:Putative ribonuclease H-like domain-containing protein n=1 Tax=Tanacetum cinerariifolium TaxID=118510 RepID=A0A6L2LQ58_TANCI|nr:putative ribonuclease H-like domain-containing protein [Tanacetum cinerariifolium]